MSLSINELHHIKVCHIKERNASSDAFLTGYCENICFNEKKKYFDFFLNIKLYLKKQKQNWQSNSCSFFFLQISFFNCRPYTIYAYVFFI